MFEQGKQHVVTIYNVKIPVGVDDYWLGTQEGNQSGKPRQTSAGRSLTPGPGSYYWLETVGEGWDNSPAHLELAGCAQGWPR